MAVEVEINNSPLPTARYISNVPSPCRIRTTGGKEIRAQLSSRGATNGGGQAVFYEEAASKARLRLEATLPADGSWVDFGLGGRFGFSSSEDHDCLLVVRSSEQELQVPLMVRVRKNANELTTGERDRFLGALGRLNARGLGAYQAFRDTHVSAADAEEHGGPHFLPWHRAFLLDLERELQALDPSVSLPYWRFDQPAPDVFRADFMGATAVTRSEPASQVTFGNGNALAGWVTDGVPGILRSALFDTQISAAHVISEASTLALGNSYSTFARMMEDNPHGYAHVSFVGSLSAISTAVKDPLFFLLHANVDRLWARWQWLNRLADPLDGRAYASEQRDGRRVADTMWPWNNVQTAPRPNFAPGGPMPSSLLVKAPGSSPRIGSMVDYEGRASPGSHLGYGYDDVPFEYT